MNNLSLKNKWTLFSISLLIIGAVWIWFTSVYWNTTSSEAVSVPHQGFKAPDFTAKSLDGSEISLSSLRGKAVLVNIWASWCLPCRKEMPALERVYQEYNDNGFTILAVNATDQDQIENVRSFAREMSLSFPVLLDESGEISTAYQLSALPTSFFISADGVIQKVVVGGPMSEALLRSQIEQLLKFTNPGVQ